MMVSLVEKYPNNMILTWVHCTIQYGTNSDCIDESDISEQRDVEFAGTLEGGERHKNCRFFSGGWHKRNDSYR